MLLLFHLGFPLEGMQNKKGGWLIFPNTGQCRSSCPRRHTRSSYGNAGLPGKYEPTDHDRASSEAGRHQGDWLGNGVHVSRYESTRLYRLHFLCPFLHGASLSVINLTSVCRQGPLCLLTLAQRMIIRLLFLG